MSQYPPNSPFNPGYGNVPNYYNGPIASPRPTAVTGVAITGIILASLGVLCSGGGVFLNLGALANGGKNPIMPQLPPMNHDVLAFSVFQCLFNVVLAITLLICSVAALSLKPFARRVLMPWSVVSIIWWIIICIVTLTWIAPETNRVTQAINPNTTAVFKQAHEIGTVIGAVGMSIAMCVVPVLVLTLWNRPHVKAAFGDTPGTQR